MLQAQFITIALLAPSGVADPDRAIAEAAQHQRDFGEPAAKQALARYGFFPFAYGRFSDRREAADRGLTHCAAIRGDAAWFCARLSARIVDRSPVHLRVEALPGFRLMAAHYVEADGRVRRLLPDAEAIFDLPSAPTSVAIGVTVKGSEGPETGLYIPLRSDHFVPDPCQEGGQLDALTEAINAARADLGAGALEAVDAPSAYERARGAELSQRFGHSQLGLSRFLSHHQIRLRHAAEVVAEDASLTAICRGWMLSPSHRAALLDGRRNQIAYVKRGDRISALLWYRP